MIRSLPIYGDKRCVHVLGMTADWDQNLDLSTQYIMSTFFLRPLSPRALHITYITHYIYPYGQTSDQMLTYTISLLSSSVYSRCHSAGSCCFAVRVPSVPNGVTGVSVLWREATAVTVTSVTMSALATGGGGDIF